MSLRRARASVERGKEIALDAGEIVLHADARLGELTRELQKAPRKGKTEGKGGRVIVPDGNNKSAALASEGLSRKQAAQCEKIAALKDSGDLDQYVAAEQAARSISDLLRGPDAACKK